MAISSITNGESGSSARASLNQVIAFANGTLANPVSYTGDPTGLSYSVAQQGLFENGAYTGALIVTDSTTEADGLLTLNYGSVAGFSGNYGPTMNDLTSLTLDSFTDFPFTFNPIIPSLTTLGLTGLTSITGTFSPTLAALTTLSLSSLTSITGSFAPVIDAVTSLNLSSLTALGHGSFNPTATSLTTLNLSGLVTLTASFNPNLPAATSVNLSNLVHSGPAFNCEFDAWLAQSFPALVDGDFGIGSNNATSLSLPLYQDDLASINLSANFGPFLPKVVTVSLPSIIHLDGGISCEDGSLAACVNFSLGSTLKRVGNDVLLSGAALSQTSVNGILVSLAALDGTGGTTLFQNHTVDLSGGTSATPSGAGLTAKTTLQGRGCTVTTN